MTLKDRGVRQEQRKTDTVSIRYTDRDRQTDTEINTRHGSLLMVRNKDRLR